MRPLVVVSSLRPGGAERVTVSLLRRLAATGRTVPCVALDRGGPDSLAPELERASVPVRCLGLRRLARPAALGRWLGTLRDLGADVIHAHGQDASILAAVGRAFHGAPLAVTRHVLDEPASSWRERARRRAALLALRRADLPVAVSQAAADRLAELARIQRQRIRVIPNGIELEAFEPAALEPRRRPVRAALGLADDVPAVLVLAVLRPGKGHEVLIDLLPELRRAIPGVRLLVAGGGQLEASLRLRAQPLSDAVLLLGHRTDVPDLLAACDVVALPSEAEALPTALIEAAAAGRACVATRVGGTPEVVEDGVTGLLVPPGDGAALRDALAALLRDAPRRRRMGDAGRDRARRLFSIDRQAEDTWQAWRGLAARPA